MSETIQDQVIDREKFIENLPDMFVDVRALPAPRTPWRRVADEKIDECTLRLAKEFILMCPHLTHDEAMKVIEPLQVARVNAKWLLCTREMGR